jgi:hypothetical protein
MKRYLGIVCDVISVGVLGWLFITYVPQGGLGVSFTGSIFAAILIFLTILSNKSVLVLWIASIVGIVLLRRYLKRKAGKSYPSRAFISLLLVIIIGAILHVLSFGSRTTLEQIHNSLASAGMYEGASPQARHIKALAIIKDKDSLIVMAGTAEHELLISAADQGYAPAIYDLSEYTYEYDSIAIIYGWAERENADARDIAMPVHFMRQRERLKSLSDKGEVKAKAWLALYDRTLARDAKAYDEIIASLRSTGMDGAAIIGRHLGATAEGWRAKADFRLIEWAAEAGDLESLRRLAYIYEKVPTFADKDLVKSRHYYEIAAARGDEEALERLKVW